MMHNCPFLFLFSNCTNDHNLENIGGGGGGCLPPLLALLMFYSFTYNTEGPWHSGIDVCYIKYIGIPELRYTYIYVYNIGVAKYIDYTMAEGSTYFPFNRQSSLFCTCAMLGL